MKRPPTISALTGCDPASRLLEFEEERDLFARTVAGRPFWEFLRLPVYYALANALGVMRFPPLRPSRRSPWSIARAGLSLGLGSVRRNPFRVGRRSLLVLGYPRRTLVDGRWEDVHFDPLLEALPADALYLEPAQEGLHRRAVATRDRALHDAIDLGAALGRWLRPLRLDSRDRATLAEVSAELESAFGVAVDLDGIAAAILPRQRALRPWYRRLLEQVRPRLVLLTSPNYREFTLIEVARELGIPTAEMQHGAFGEHDPSYAFPPNGSGPGGFADHLLVFGDYWRDQLDRLPPGTSVRTVGYAHLERELARNTARGEALVFLSQQTIGASLSRFAVDLSRLPGFSTPIVYRLHPDEKNWRRRYPWLAESGIRIETNADRSVYAALADARAQIGVYSLAVYEGLAFGLRTLLVDLPGVEQLRRLVDEGCADRVARPEDVPRLLLAPSRPIDVERFVRPNAVANVAAFVREIVGGIDTNPNRERQPRALQRPDEDRRRSA